LGRVISTVVATEKTPDLEGVRFLIVQPLTRDLADRGRPVIAADGVHMAGPGELIYFVGSREAAQAMPEPFVPVDHAIVGIVDQLAVEPLPPRKKPVTRKPAARKPVARKPVARKPAAKKAGDK
jgi:ethanolamine utilization protein EutN